MDFPLLSRLGKDVNELLKAMSDQLTWLFKYFKHESVVLIFDKEVLFLVVSRFGYALLARKNTLVFLFSSVSSALSTDLSLLSARPDIPNLL